MQISSLTLEVFEVHCYRVGGPKEASSDSKSMQMLCQIFAHAHSHLPICYSYIVEIYIVNNTKNYLNNENVF